jgi:hydrogenase maturation protease
VTDPRRALVVGLGSRARGDDGVGPEVAEQLHRLRPGAVDVVISDDPTSMIDLLDGHDPVIVVDAMRAGHPPGTVVTLETGADRPPLPVGLAAGPASTHGIGLAAALEWARALGRLPETVAVVAVEASSFDHGAALSDPVRAAIPAAVDAILCLLEPSAGQNPA